MKIIRHLGFGSTPNFPNLFKDVQKLTGNNGRLAYANYDPSLGKPPTETQIELLQNYKTEMPVITFKGSEKLHGENMAVCFSAGELWVQGRNHIRTTISDQNSMAQFVETSKPIWLNLFEQIATKYCIPTDDFTIILDCEWAGGSIQKGNAACSGTDKGAYIFDFCRVVWNDTDESQYKSTDGLNVPTNSSIYIMKSFGYHSITLDFNDPSKCEENLKTLAETIEVNSSIAKFFDKPDNVGEGVYLWALYNGQVLRLKAKGEKHGGKPKVKKSQTPVNNEQLAKLIALAHKVTPVWRITQAITTTNSTERKHLGTVIGWVITDIEKEEQPLLETASIEIKQINKFISAIVKEYYFDSLKGY